MAEEKKVEDAVFRIFIKADIQRVWRELTKQGEAQGAVFNAWLHSAGALKAGVPMQMRTGTGKHVMVHGRVELLEPPYRFVHTHRFTEFDDPVCRVSYELKPVGEGVEVTLTVLGMPSGTRTAKSMASGGKQILATLKAICETGRPGLGMRALYWLFAHMEFVLPARTKAEHWPLDKP
jgi:uncharacterized protein YndB with AHSA1/START domain